MILFFIPQPGALANTQTGAPPVVIKGDFKSLKHTMSARIDKVIDQQTVLLKDGKIVRLLGLDYPQGTEENPPEEPFLAKQELDRLLPEGTEVMLYQKRQIADVKRGRVNRMGQQLAHLVRKDNEQWINGTLVADGLARALTSASNAEMVEQLYALEDRARKDEKVLWAKTSPNGLLTPDTAAQGNGQLRVVEGTVNRAATSKNNLYLNFGDDWRKDFTVMIPVQLRKTLARSGIDPMSLTGKTIRVRGWIREWNGPFMELETPERLEIVTTSGPSTETPPEPSTAPVENEVMPAPARPAQQHND